MTELKACGGRQECREGPGRATSVCDLPLPALNYLNCIDGQISRSEPVLHGRGSSEATTASMSLFLRIISRTYPTLFCMQRGPHDKGDRGSPLDLSISTIWVFSHGIKR